MADITEKYEIIVNQTRHHILVINDVVDVDKEDALAFEDFDAVFINIVDSVLDRNMLAIRLASPLQSEKCRFKPCFVTQRLKTWLAHATDILVDGYASSPTDAIVSQTINEIYANMRRYNFLLGTEPIITHAQEVFRLCRYSISRGQLTFSSHATPGLNSGYMALYYNTIWNPEQVQLHLEECEYFHRQLMDLGYIRRKRYLEKLHVCPDCTSSNLLFFETCPSCGSSHLKEQPVIHHFRCAHVAPESEYEWDGELRCPKCKRQLLHIGVDYDKPSAVYTCQECKESFMYPAMKVLCAACRRVYKPGDLMPIDVEEYEFTTDGIRALANNDIGISISQVGFYGHSTMRDFEEYIRQYGDSKNEKNKEFLLVMRFHIYDPDLLMPRPGETVPRIVKWLRRLYNYKSALQGTDYYFMCRVMPGQVTQRQAEMEYELKAEFEDYGNRYSDFIFDLHSTHVFHYGEDVQRFINQVEMI